MQGTVDSVRDRNVRSMAAILPAQQHVPLPTKPSAHPPSRRRRRTFPLHAPRLVHVHMHIHQPRRQHSASIVQHRQGWRAAQRSLCQSSTVGAGAAGVDGCDHAAAHVHWRREGAEAEGGVHVSAGQAGRRQRMQRPAAELDQPVDPQPITPHLRQAAPIRAA